MNKVSYLLMTIVASILLFTSCDREALSFEKDKGDNNPTFVGDLNLSSLKIGVNAADGVNASTRAGVDVSNFMLTIYEDGETEPVKSFAYSEMPEILSLTVGSYTVEVNSHVPEASAWDKPHYFASKTFTIKKNETTDIGTVTCYLKSIKTTIEFTNELKALLGDDVKVKIVANNDGELVFAKDETRAGYYKAANEDANILTATLSGTVDGQSVNVVNSFTGIKAGEHRNIKYSLKTNPGDTDGGNVGFTIEIDAKCEIVDVTISIDPDVDPVDPPVVPPVDPPGPSDENDPTIVGTSFGGSAFDIDDSHVVPNGGCEIIVTLKAPNKMAHVNVTIDSDKLTEDILTGVGLKKSFDLAYPGDLELALGSAINPENNMPGLGFPVGNEVIGQTELLFNITEFTPLLGIYGAGTHNFIIEVIDQEEVSVTKTLTLITE